MSQNQSQCDLLITLLANQELHQFKKMVIIGKKKV